MANNKTTYYDILEVSQTASLQEIKLAYRRLVIQYHPDRIGDTEENRNRFFAIQKAYDTLSDENERNAYDRQLKGLGDGLRSGDKAVRSVTNSLITFEARIMQNEGSKMSEADKAVVKTAMSYARELFYDRENIARGDYDVFAAKLLKEVVSSKREINRNAAVADYLDEFANCIINSTPVPAFVSEKSIRRKKMMKYAAIAFFAIIVLGGVMKFIRRAPAADPEDQPKPAMAIPQNAAAPVPYEDTDSNSVMDGKVGKREADKDSLLLKDSGIYD